MVPSWLKPRELVYWNLEAQGKVLCRVSNVSGECVSLTILHATQEQILNMRRGPGEATGVIYRDGLLELAR